MAFKENVDEIYSNGVFELTVGDDIASVTVMFLGASKKKIEKEKEEDPMQRKLQDGVILAKSIPLNQELKSFQEVLTGRKDSIGAPNNLNKKHDDEAYPPRPVNSPRLEGGNAIVEVDEEDYKK